MNLKYLDEQRAENHNKMQEILESAKKEERALNEEEISKFNELKKLIEEIDATIQAEEESREMDIEEKKENKNEEIKDDVEKIDNVKNEERAFAEYIVSGKQRANSPGMSYGSNGAIVPTTIAKKIIEKVKELSPIYDKVEKFTTKGTLEIPVYDTDSDATSPYGRRKCSISGRRIHSISCRSRQIHIC